MSKFIKRIKKSLPDTRNAIVIGDAFGYLEDVSEIFNSVFIVYKDEPRLKKRNFIYRDNINGLEHLPEINALFLDLKYKKMIDDLEYIMLMSKPTFIIEGNEPIGREFTKKFYTTGYRAVEQQGFFHVWKKIE